MDYQNNAQQRLLKVIECLATVPFEGATATDVSRSIDAGQPQTFRTLKNLEIAGWAEQRDIGTWRLTRRATLVSEKLRLTIADLHHRYLDPAPPNCSIRSPRSVTT